MLDSIQAPLFFGLIAAFVTTIGLLTVALRRDWSERYADLFGLTAAGMLITLAFLHILPEAFSLTTHAPVWLTAGFFGGLVLNFLVHTILPDREVTMLPREAITPILAIAIHSFVDGIVYSVTFAASFSSGVFTALSLILHEFPEGVIAFAILRRHHVSNRVSFIGAFLASALTTPLGVLVSGPFMYGLGSTTIGALFALSAGLLLYVATGPLMAPLKAMPPVRGLVALLAGVGLALVLIRIPLPGEPHHHLDAVDPGFEQPQFLPMHPEETPGHRP